MIQVQSVSWEGCVFLCGNSSPTLDSVCSVQLMLFDVGTMANPSLLKPPVLFFP